MMQVAGAKNDGIHVGGRTVLERTGIVLDLLRQRSFLEVVGPLVAQRDGMAMGDGDRLAAVFLALRRDVARRERRSDDEDVFPLEL